MGYSTFYGMEIARSGLYVAQSQLNITGHNISNVDTEGYTRQRLDTAAKVIGDPMLQFALDRRSSTGQGSESLSVGQIRDLFLDVTYRDESTETSYWQTMENQFYMVEQIFDSVLEDNDSSASIFNALQNFAEALADVNENVSDKDVRTTLVEAGLALTESFNYVYGKLAEQHANVNDNIASTVLRINDIADAIANLNFQIFGYELAGGKANDLRDQRNELMDELSTLIGFDYYENEKGHITITVGGRELVEGYDSYHMTVYADMDNQLDVLNNEAIIGQQYSVRWADVFGKPGLSYEDVVRVEGGTMQAYFDIRDGLDEDTPGIPYAAQMLNELARRIAREVNDQFRQGWTLPFTADDVNNSDSIQKDPNILSNSYLVYYHQMEDTGEKDAEGNPIYRAAIDPDTGKYIWQIRIEETVNDATAAGDKTDTGKAYYPSVNGIDFFISGEYDDYREINAKNFRISEAMYSTPYLIAASSQPVLPPDDSYNEENQLMGDNKNLLKVAALFSKKDEMGLPDNFASSLKSMIVSIATAQKHNGDMVDAQETRLAAIEEQKQSVSGVSLDDEMTDMVRFTHAYNAAARILTAIDEELDVLINRMGRVGL